VAIGTLPALQIILHNFYIDFQSLGHTQTILMIEIKHFGFTILINFSANCVVLSIVGTIFEELLSLEDSEKKS
jgi:hypothetical protein